MYRYKAIITRVVDGDTFDAVIDLGFKIVSHQRLRLKGVDTPETWRPKSEAEKIHGKQATEFVSNLILDKEVILTSVKSAVYNRYEAYVELEDGSDLGELLIENNFIKKDSYED